MERELSEKTDAYSTEITKTLMRCESKRSTLSYSVVMYHTSSASYVASSLPTVTLLEYSCVIDVQYHLFIVRDSM